jgi:hypothetical protein
MMISAAPPEARQSHPSPQLTNCSQKREQRGMPVEMVRIMGLDTAAQLLGKGRLADELCITVRALNYKIDAGRGVSDADVVAAARGLEERAERFLAHAQKLRGVIAPAVSDTVTAAPLGQASIVLAHCDHVERFAYERQGQGLDASPHMLSAAARKLAEAILPKTKTAARANPLDASS